MAPPDETPASSRNESAKAEGVGTGQNEGVTIRARAYILILGVQALLTVWVADSEIARGIYLVCYALMMPTVLYLLTTRTLSRFLPFNRHEILLGYIVLTATLPIVGFGGLRFLIAGMGCLSFFSETQPHWKPYLNLLPHLPLLHDPAAIQALYKGQSAIPWSAWAGPIAFWSGYLLLLSGVWLGFAAVLHRIWIRQERMTFPITVLPLQLTDPNDDLFGRRLFWIGAAIPALLQSLLALHEWYPTIPAFTLKATDIRPALFPSAPWNTIPNLSIGYYPMAMGLAYFAPGNITFSCWFFLLLSKLSYAGSAMLGWGAGGPGTTGRFPFREEQASGAWIGFAILTLWSARRHFGDLLKELSHRDQRAMYAWGGVGLICIALCAVMMTLAGVAPGIAVLTLAIYIAFVLAGARIRAEAGGMWTFAPTVWTPNRAANLAAGTLGTPAASLVAGAHFDLIHMDIRAQSLPYLLEGLKIADTVGIRWRTVLIAVAVGSVSALALGWWSTLAQFCALGAATAKSSSYALVKPQDAMIGMSNLLTNRAPADTSGIAAMAFAAAFTLLIAALRTGFLEFPLHPIGYVVANTYTMNALFVPIFAAWLAKTLILRYGGNGLYRRSLPFFVGVVLGDMMIQVFWTLIGRALDAPVYQFLS